VKRKEKNLGKENFEKSIGNEQQYHIFFPKSRVCAQMKISFEHT
jgi:hypothetical protein